MQNFPEVMMPSKSATFRDRDLQNLLTDDGKVSKTNIQIATVRSTGNFEKTWDFKNSLRQTDFAKEIEKERKLKKSRYQRNLARELETEKRNQLHKQNQDIQLQLFSYDLPYEKESVPNYMFGSEQLNSRSSEQVSNNLQNSEGT